MLPFTYSVDRPQAFSPLLSTGYTLIARDDLPPGRFIFAASQIKAFEEAQDTSRALFNLKRQVSVAALGLEAGSVTSFSLRMITVLSLFLAASYFANWADVSTSAGFCNSPPATTMCEAGAVMEKSKSPYSR